jgi:ribonuclease G
VKGALTLLTTLPHGGTAAARLVDGRLEDLLLDPPPYDPAPRPGAIHRGVVGRPMKGLGGAIVDLGDGRQGFLRETRGLAPGRPVLVQVGGWAEAHKAPPVSRRLLVKGRFAIVTPDAPGFNLSRATPAEARPRLEALAQAVMAGAPLGVGLVLRTAAADAPEAAVLEEVARLRAEAERLGPDGTAPIRLLPGPTAAEEAVRDWPDPGPHGVREGPRVFAEHEVEAMIDALRTPRVALPGGGRVFVEPTRAHVAVDVDTGADLSPAAAISANVAAAREIPRQLRLRGLGGPVAIDFAPLAKKDRPRVVDALKAALGRDGIETSVAGWTPLGALELLRKRSRRPLAGLLAAVDAAQAAAD